MIQLWTAVIFRKEWAVYLLTPMILDFQSSERKKYELSLNNLPECWSHHSWLSGRWLLVTGDGSMTTWTDHNCLLSVADHLHLAFLWYMSSVIYEYVWSITQPWLNFFICCELIILKLSWPGIVLVVLYFSQAHVFDDWDHLDWVPDDTLFLVVYDTPFTPITLWFRFSDYGLLSMQTLKQDEETCLHSTIIFSAK